MYICVNCRAAPTPLVLSHTTPCGVNKCEVWIFPCFDLHLILQDKEIERGDIYEVRKIANKRKRDDGEWAYLVEWVGYEDVTWQVASTLTGGAMATLTKFNEEYGKGDKQGGASHKTRKKKK